MLDLFILNLILFTTQTSIDEAPGSSLVTTHTFYWSLLNLLWLTMAGLGRIYAYQELTSFRSFTKSTFGGYFIWAFFVMVMAFVFNGFFPLPQVFLYSAILYFAEGLLFNRLLFLAIRLWVSNKAYFHRRIIILGYNSLSRKLAAHLAIEEPNARIVGFIDETGNVPKVSSMPVFSGISNTMHIAGMQNITEIFSTVMPEDNNEIYQLMKQADKALIRFRIVPNFASVINRPVHMDYIRDIPILSERKEPLEEVINRVQKRIFDIAISSVAIVFVLSWLAPLLSLIIYATSPGPVFFAQWRNGKNNRPFRCFKFRSMAVSSESDSRQATRNDVRVTSIGRFMRKTSLDEFPQFINVLLGNMSIVGPRPHMLEHTKRFSAQEEHYMVRQFAKPGITGWAQTNGYRGEITDVKQIQKRVQYDLWYLENWSLALDLKITFLTIYNGLKGDSKAY
ncbi:exopolysaccharide biosynthesis polyprenyl glycosylphosphotransferase [Hymenobacter glacialis]|uniref:exopolysaccharide biosynthesis polyprenyl glycosylphosphotransferase n=1 Tax=Hymenobacter glacialis TaxID=1908236 RepID=UPI001F4DC092|nr:exopolysaccharide biosynthesis polyprenyl glycosylphosphotransferase [Hymenobacter glacialis]